MSSNNVLPQTSGDLSIVHYADAQGNENFFIRAWVKGSKVLIPLKEVMDDVNSSIENIKKLIPEGTSEQNPLVNNLKLYKELHRVPNGGTLLAGAKVGDILWVDPNNGDKYFFDKVVYPVSQAVADGLESVGVVADVDGRKKNAETLGEIFDLDTPFTQCDDLDTCTSCDYADICRR